MRVRGTDDASAGNSCCGFGGLALTLLATVVAAQVELHA